MIYGRDFTISSFNRRNHGSGRGDHGPRRNLKSKHFNAVSIHMRNRYQCNLATHEGMKTYKRLYARNSRSQKFLENKGGVTS